MEAVQVGFLHARQDPQYAELMIASVRKHMDCQIVQWTDLVTDEVKGVDQVERRPWDGKDPMRFKMAFLAMYDQILALDTDVIVQADLSTIFAFRFDVALTWRDGPIRDPQGNDITKAMPFNCGVMWSKSKAYWKACLRWCEQNNIHNWYEDQLAVANVRGFDVLKLHCDNFNHTPMTRDEDVSSRYAVHYKGKRKDWMQHG